MCFNITLLKVVFFFFAVFLDHYVFGLMLIAIITCVLSFLYHLDYLAYFEPKQLLKEQN